MVYNLSLINGDVNYFPFSDQGNGATQTQSKVKKNYCHSPDYYYQASAELFEKEELTESPSDGRAFSEYADSVFDVMTKSAAIPIKIHNFYHNIRRDLDTSHYTQAYNLLEVLNVASSAISLVDGKNSWQEACKTDDTAGKFFAMNNIVKSSLEVAMGIPEVPLECYSAVGALFNKANLPGVGSVFSGLQKTMTFVYAILNFIPATYKTLHSARFGLDFFQKRGGSELSKSARNVRSLQHLMRKFTVEEGDLSVALSKADKKWKAGREVKPLNEIEIARLGEGVHELVAALRDQLTQRVQDLTEQVHIPLDELAKYQDHAFEAEVLRELSKLQARKTAQLSRAIGVDAYEALKAELKKPFSEQLLNRVSEGQMNADIQKRLDQIVLKVWTGIALQILLRGTLAVTAVIGVALLIASFFTVGPIGTIVLFALSFFLSGASLSVNLYDLAMCFKHRAPGRYDALFLILGGIVISVVTAVAFVFTTGLAGYLLLAAIIGGWLAISLGFVLYRALSQRQAQSA